VPGICSVNGVAIPREDVTITISNGSILSMDEARTNGFFIMLKLRVPLQSTGFLQCSEFQIFPMQ
jgi:hypothetical protein